MRRHDAERGLIIGHRGCPSLAPENSLEGFRQALALGVDGVEFDVHLAADGVPVVIHDPYLERTTTASGPVAAQASADLGRIRLKGGGAHQVPLLSEVLEVLAAGQAELHIELKVDVLGRPYPGLAATIAQQVTARGLLDRCVFTCFIPEVLQELRRLLPGCRLLGSFNRTSIEMRGGWPAARAPWDALAPCLLAVEKKFLTYLQDTHGAEWPPERLGVWVVNDAEELRKWLSQPVRQITTDRPELALLLRRQLGVAGWQAEQTV